MVKMMVKYEFFEKSYKIEILTCLSIALIFFSKAIYYIIANLSIITFIVGILIFVGCFYWLLKNRKDKDIKNSLILYFSSFLVATGVYFYL